MLLMRLLSTIWFLLTARCRDATRIFSDEHEQKVSLVDWWGARLHWISCGPCRRYCKQQKLIDQLFEQMPDEVRARFALQEPDWQLSEEAKSRLEAALKQAQENEKPANTDE